MSEALEIQSMTAKDFCDSLREAIVKVVNGEHDEIRFSTAMISAMCAPEEAAKLTTSYMRVVLNRVPEVKAVGRASIKSARNEDGMAEYVITINRDVKRKVLTSNDLDSLHAKWQAKFIKQLLNTQPRITDLDGDKLAGAAIAMERFAEMLKDMIKEEAE